MLLHNIIFFFLLALVFSTNPSHGELCVADLKGGPAYGYSNRGYPCKNVSTLTVDDFVFPNFKAGTPPNIFKFSTVPAFVEQFPGLNGLGISALRIDMSPGGFVPMHIHPSGTEMVMMVSGQMTLGFISTNQVSTSQVYYKTLTEGDVMVIPQGLLHFVINAGNDTTCTAFVAFSSTNPGVETLPIDLFGNSLPTELVAKTTLLDPQEVKKLKASFGGSG